MKRKHTTNKMEEWLNRFHMQTDLWMDWRIGGLLVTELTSARLTTKASGGGLGCVGHFSNISATQDLYNSACDIRTHTALLGIPHHIPHDIPGHNTLFSKLNLALLIYTCLLETIT